ncbi:MAG: CHAT domain-containing protein [Nitrososphaeraceae archaeon]
MNEFYLNLKKGKDKALSLRKAQLKIMCNEKFRQPLYWAPFILIGSWI